MSIWLYAVVSCHHQVLHTRHNAHGTEVDGTEGRATETLDRDTRGPGTPASIEQGHACNAGALFTSLSTTSGNYIINLSMLRLVTIDG